MAPCIQQQTTSGDPAFTISGLLGPCIHYIWSPRPCIHYIWSPRTLHSLYLVSLDPALTISGLPGSCIHYIWSPWTLHSLYIWSPWTLHSLYPLS
ncbi:unnamed protein product, partial [Staurois parvus]